MCTCQCASVTMGKHGKRREGQLLHPLLLLQPYLPVCTVWKRLSSTARNNLQSFPQAAALIPHALPPAFLEAWGVRSMWDAGALTPHEQPCACGSPSRCVNWQQSRGGVAKQCFQTWACLAARASECLATSWGNLDAVISVPVKRSAVCVCVCWCVFQRMHLYKLLYLFYHCELKLNNRRKAAAVWRGCFWALRTKKKKKKKKR